MNINDVNKAVHAHKRRKRRGRGAASGIGKTAGRGQKGLGQRAGANYLKGFVGGQQQLRQRIPKRGFNNANFRVEYVPVNLWFLEKAFNDGDTVGVIELAQHGVTIRRNDVVKVLGTGELTKKLTVQAHAFSKAAVEKIEKAGGAVVTLGAPAEATDEKTKEDASQGQE